MRRLREYLQPLSAEHRREYLEDCAPELQGLELNAAEFK